MPCRFLEILVFLGLFFMPHPVYLGYYPTQRHPKNPNKQSHNMYDL